MPTLTLLPIKPKVPWIKLPSILVDHSMKSLRDTELRILLMLVRISSARTNPAAPVKLTYKRLTEQTGRHKEAVVSAIRNLTALGLIQSDIRGGSEES